MAVPTNRETLIDYCLRRLGEPVIQVAQNLDPDQIDDRIDDAFLYFANYHFDGIEKVFLAHQITAQNIIDGYIQVPPLVVSITRVMPLGSSDRNMGMFDVQYQMRLNDLYTFTSTSIIYYDLMMKHLALLNFEFNVEPSIQYTRHQDKLYINQDWSNMAVGDYLIIECYRMLDPDEYPDMYNDLWLKAYCTELIRLQWGTNLSKYGGVILVGGVTLNGLEIYQKALDNIEKLEVQVKSEYQLPVDFMIG